MCIIILFELYIGQEIGLYIIAVSFYHLLYKLLLQKLVYIQT